MQFIKLEAQSAYDDALNSVGCKQRILVCGAEEEKEYVEENLESALEGPQLIIDASEKIDGEKWLHDKKIALEYLCNNLQEIIDRLRPMISV